MVELVGICQLIIGLFGKIKDMMDKFDTNQEHCARIRELGYTIPAVLEPLKQAQPNIAENMEMSAALERLEKSLKKSSDVVETCEKKRTICSYIQANGIARDLSRVHVDILDKMNMLNLANNVDNTLMLKQIRDTLVDLYTKILEIIDAQPRQEMRTTEYAREHGSCGLEVKNEKQNVPAADIKAPHASLFSGSAKSTSAKNVIGQDGPSIANKDPSHRSNPANGAGSRKKENKIRKTCGRNTTGSNKIEKANVPADSNGSRASLSYAKSTSVENMDGRAHPRIVNKMTISTKNMTWVTSIDVHPAKPWIVMGHEGGNVSIWDHQKEKTVIKKQVTKEPGRMANIMHEFSQYIKEGAAKHWVCSVKFITQKWLAVGDGNGYIHVYDCTNTELPEVKKFKAHNGASVDLFAVHPTKAYCLSSCAYGRMIELWDWSSDWKKIQEFDIKPTYEDGVRSLKFNPRDTNTFSCVMYDGRVKVGNIKSSSLTTKLKGLSEADYFFTHNELHLMVTLSSGSHDAEIHDLETGKVVHILGGSGKRTTLVAGHPTLPILVTALDDDTVCLWDANTYRLEKKVRIKDKSIRDLTFVTDVNAITRLAVTSRSMITIMEVELPKAVQANRLVVETNADIS